MTEVTGEEVRAANGFPNPLSAAASPEKSSLERYGPTVVRVASVALGAAGICIFCRSVRMFTQFKNATDIPQQFYERHVRLRGIVEAVDANGQLQVSHSPIMWLPWQRPQPSRLSVYLAGIEMASGGADWLRHNLSSKIVKFELMKRREQHILADVFARRTRWSPLFYNVNRELVRRGLSRVISFENEEHLHDMQSIPRYGRLIQRLLISEHYADKRGIGHWKRQNVVEAMASYPQQGVEMIKHSSAAAFVALFYHQMKAATSFLVAAGQRWLPLFFHLLRFVYDSAKRTFGLLWNLVQSKKRR